ncbi:DUF2268 domain-containing putative Zn-dependent protease [Rubrivivax gelatinosus]|uniref:Putative Zn-dependent protease DUF2268 n=1 Tax=Rubrivivax gelatinosus TaxID=28068 RepID=A0A4R2MF34_RUBGE|nr:DUF2268 domain-containing putative Zn-dependent protease [Rubrivivax gelatinosus]MBK1688360.1 hypothetical protein [Rubrivivax gelatinosus]TCP03347.1 putative Zn-dependent protease DUF2268 [Rubrivivax gelatinosus]
MPAQLHLLDAGGVFGVLRPRVEQAFASTIGLVGRLLPIGAVDVVVQHDPRLVIPELGLGGYTPAADRVFMTLDLGHAGLRQRLEPVFTALLAHELHHTVRWAGPGYGRTLAEAAVSEGLACCFEAELPGGELPFYARPLPAAERERVWAAFAAQRDASSYDHEAWFYGRGALPRHAGYALGAEIVARHLQRCGGSAAARVQAPAATLLEGFRPSS